MLLNALDKFLVLFVKYWAAVASFFICIVSLVVFFKAFHHDPHGHLWLLWSRLFSSFAVFFFLSSLLAVFSKNSFVSTSPGVSLEKGSVGPVSKNKASGFASSYLHLAVSLFSFCCVFSFSAVVFNFIGYHTASVRDYLIGAFALLVVLLAAFFVFSVQQKSKQVDVL